MTLQERLMMAAWWLLLSNLRDEIGTTQADWCAYDETCGEIYWELSYDLCDAFATFADEGYEI